MVKLTIDEQCVEVPKGATVWEAARAAGVDVPVLCHDPKLEPAGVCRVCAVEVDGSRLLVPSCVRCAEDGMVVRTDSDRVERSRKMLVELLMAEHPTPCAKQQQWGNCELERMAAEWSVTPRFSQNGSRAEENGDDTASPQPSTIRRKDNSSPVIAVDHAACIMCDKCIRACDDIQSNDVIGRMLKGHDARIAFDDDEPMGESTCVSCGECASVCPTGALIDKPLLQMSDEAWQMVGQGEAKQVDSVCPYCGVGCAVKYHVVEEKIARVTGRDDGPANLGRLCVKGRYGFDYAHHEERLTVPLIRKSDFYPKEPLFDFTKEFDFRAFRKAARKVDWREAFREATWDEALDLAASKFMEVKREHGPGALAGFGSAKVSNEEAYLFQKLVRQAFGTNNVDHCTRLCHASSVAALIEGVGSGAVSNPFQDALLADVLFCVGTNTTENHPVAATFLKAAAKRGTSIIVIDPRRPDLANHARYYIREKPGTDVALINAMMHVIINEGLHDPGFIAERTEGYEALKKTVESYTPELGEQITGVPKETIIEIARAYGEAKNAMIFWGMGVSQHTHGTDNARCLIALCLLTGNVGRPGTGLHPLRGQNNVQGASDVGLIPMVYPGYQSVEDPEVRRKFEAAWGTPLDAKSGLTVVEIMHGALHGEIKAMLMMGENPFLSDPNLNKVRSALSTMEFLVVQDIFLTETAEFADVVFPGAVAAERAGTYVNTNRDVQLAHRAIDPPGEARQDWTILTDLANRMFALEGNGGRWDYASPAEVWEEVRSLTPIFGGVSYERLERGDRPVWPCSTEEEKGNYVLFTDDFPTASGRGKFVPAEFAPGKELPDDEFPFVLNTGRVLYHWHTGTMTRRSKVLDERSPGPYVEVNPVDLERLGVEDGEVIRVRSRRGNIVLPARALSRVAEGNVFIPFHFKEAAVNLLTSDALDPYGKIPAYKFCAVRLERAPAGRKGD